MISYARDSVNPHSGTAAQKITLVSGTRVQFAQFFANPFKANQLYTVSVWMRARSPMSVTLWLRQSGSPYAG